jgi:exosome complex RNA-binding protein Csl4
MELDDAQLPAGLLSHSATPTVSRRAANIRHAHSAAHSATHSQSLVVPGQTITTEQGFLRGHGTYFELQEEQQGQGQGAGQGQGEEHLVASLAGSLQRVNKLVSVLPPSSRYHPTHSLTHSLLHASRFTALLYTHCLSATMYLVCNSSHCDAILIPYRYIGEIGDLVVGRITAVESKRWKCDVSSQKVWQPPSPWWL